MGTLCIVPTHRPALACKTRPALALRVAAAWRRDTYTPVLGSRVWLEIRWAGTNRLPVDNVTDSVGTTGSVTRGCTAAVQTHTVQLAVIVPIGTHALGVAACGVGITNHSGGTLALVGAA